MVDRELPDTPLSLASGELLLDRYRVVDLLGEGAHSRVYRGHDERLDRPVCIKLFHRLRQNARAYRESYERFVQEAFSLSKLAHPSTLRIYDFGHVGEEGPPFQVSELMNGGTLAECVRAAGRLPVQEVVGLVTALCGALSEAHDQGIIHRDIKPGNVLLSTVGSDSVVKLADFGIATLFSAEGVADECTGDGESQGRTIRMYSRRWAAPEQMTSYPVTPASDLYSLALVSIFALTGRAVFAQKEPGAAYAERMASDDRIDEVLADVDVSPSLRSHLKAACSFDPRRRPASADELGHALVRALSESHVFRAGSAPRPRQRLVLSEPTAMVGGHRLRVIPATGGSAELSNEAGMRLQITFVPAANETLFTHIKAVGALSQHRGGRPSRAVQLSASGEVEIVAPNGRLLGRAGIGFSQRDAGEPLLSLGEQDAALPPSECRHALLVDFGDADKALVFLPLHPERPAPPHAP